MQALFGRAQRTVSQPSESACSDAACGAPAPACRSRRLVDWRHGPLAQLVERHVYTVDVVGSIPAGPTSLIGSARRRSHPSSRSCDTTCGSDEVDVARLAEPRALPRVREVDRRSRSPARSGTAARSRPQVEHQVDADQRRQPRQPRVQRHPERRGRSGACGAARSRRCDTRTNADSVPMLTISSSTPIGREARRRAPRSTVTMIEITQGVRNRGCTLASPTGSSASRRHREDDARGADQQGQHDRGEARDRARRDERRHPVRAVVRRTRWRGRPRDRAPGRAPCR